MPSKSKEVHREYQTKHYQANKQYYKDKRAKRRDETLDKFRRLKSRLKCQNCPESDPCTIDFHHTRDKEELLSRLVRNGVGWGRIVEEIEKCQALCACCHRKYHVRCEVAVTVDRLPTIVVPDDLR